MTFEIKLGKRVETFTLPPQNHMGTLTPQPFTPQQTGADAVRHALLHPIGSPRLSELVRAGETIAIITSDMTRPMPSADVLPPVLEELCLAGIPDRDIRIILALGAHRPHTEAEKKRLVGEAVYESDIQILDSDGEDCIRLGVCRNGTPADIFRPAVRADRRICLGNIEYHYFAGYSGGSKALMPGVSSREAIQKNHANMVKPGAFAGNLDTNPVRQDIEQIREFLSVDFIVNVVLDDRKEIVFAAAGDAVRAHRAGCRVLDQMYRVPLRKKADIAVVSPGGYPKDINLYQAQKGLDNARHAVRDGGILIWCASAAEGFGEETFERWMKTMNPDGMIEEIRRNFRLGGHKAAAIAMVLQRVEVYAVTDLPAELIRSIHLQPFTTVQEALDTALARIGTEAQVVILPVAGSTLPVFAS